MQCRSSITQGSFFVLAINHLVNLHLTKTQLFIYLLSHFLLYNVFNYSFSFHCKKRSVNCFYRLDIWYCHTLFNVLEKQNPPWLMLLCCFCLNLSALSLSPYASNTYSKEQSILGTWLHDLGPFHSLVILWSSKNVTTTTYCIK